MSTWAIILAAGGGDRFRDPEGVPKALRPVGGVPMHLRALQAFDTHPRIDGAVLVFPAIWEAQMLEDVGGSVQGPVRLIAGGAARPDSVRAGLHEIPQDATLILVHDAARPLVSAAVIDAVLDGLADAPACVPGLAVTDTVKRTSGDDVVETLSRRDLVAVQTPQGFRADVLRAAHQAGETADVTDDAQLVERLGERVVVVPGDPRNIKITTQHDLAVAEALVRMEVR